MAEIRVDPVVNVYEGRVNGIFVGNNPQNTHAVISSQNYVEGRQTFTKPNLAIKKATIHMSYSYSCTSRIGSGYSLSGCSWGIYPYHNSQFSFTGNIGTSINQSGTDVLTPAEYAAWSGVVSFSPSISQIMTPTYAGTNGDWVLTSTIRLTSCYLILELEDGTASNISPSSNGYINPTAANTFSWQYYAPGGAIGTQSSAILEYKYGGNGEVKTVNIANSNKSYTFPANFFKYSEDIRWRITVEGTDGTSATSAWTIFRTIESGKAYVNGLTPDALTSSTGQNLTFTWEIKSLSSVSQSSFRIEISQDKVNWTLLYEAPSSSNSYNAQPQSIPQGTYYWRIRLNTNLGYTAWSQIREFKLTGTPQIQNLQINQNNIDYPIVLSWMQLYQQKYEYEIYQNNILITSGAGTTQTGVSLPVGTLRATISTLFRVRIANIVDGIEVWTEWSTTSQTLTRIVPSITNFNVESLFWENDIITNWRSENQSRFEFEILRSNQVIYTANGTTAKDFVVQKGTINEAGSYVFRVRPIYVPTWDPTDLSVGTWVERSVELRDITPSITNVALSGANIDLDLTLSWQGTNYDKYEYEILKNENIVNSGNGTTGTQVLLPYNTLTVGLHKFRVRLGWKTLWTEWREINVTLVETYPSIGVLEPDGVRRERDSEILIWWTSTNQTEWQVIVDNNAYTFEGTYQTQQILQPGLLSTGTHSILLSITYITPMGVRKTIQKQVEFIVEGTPPIPTITSASVFYNNRPTIVWDTQDQQGYILNVLDLNRNLIWSTEWQNGLVVRQKVLEYLPDGPYIAQVKVINQYSKESGFGEKEFSIVTGLDAEINLQTYNDVSSAILEWETTGEPFQVFYIIRNGEVIAKTADLYYVDFTVHGECSYIVRGVTSNDVFKDSNTENVLFTIRKAVIAIVDIPQDTLSVALSRTPYSFNGNIQQENTIIHPTGRKDPIVVFGEHRSSTFNLSFTSKEIFKFLEMCEQRKVFIYRDKRQKLYLTIPEQSYKIDDIGIEYTLKGTRVDYTEVIEYD
jgi:hypothetical protein